MRTLIWFIFALMIYQNVSAQKISRNSSYELLGSISYNYSNTNSQWSGEPYSFNYETHSIAFQPSIGYFLTEEIEALIDLRYVFSSIYDGSLGFSRITREHTIGFNIGVAYNIQATHSLSIILGTKIGLSWWRGGLFEGWYINDPGWSKSQLSFPMFLVGGRFAITDDWSVLMSAEYSHTKLYYPIQYWNRKAEQVVFGFGFSVFL